MRGLTVIIIICVAAPCAGCDAGEKDGTASGIAAIASGSLAIQPVASAAPAPSAAAAEKVVRHVGAGEELVLSDALRSKLESRHPEAAGFLAVGDIEQKLFALELKRGKDDEAEKHLDRIAKGKWVLMMGPITNADADGF